MAATECSIWSRSAGRQPIRGTPRGATRGALPALASVRFEPVRPSAPPSASLKDGRPALQALGVRYETARACKQDGFIAAGPGLMIMRFHRIEGRPPPHFGAPARTASHSKPWPGPRLAQPFAAAFQRRQGTAPGPTSHGRALYRSYVVSVHTGPRHGPFWWSAHRGGQSSSRRC